MLEWYPTPKQEEFLSATEDEVFFGGAVAGGKTQALLMFQVLRRQGYAGTMGLYLRRTFPELERSVILEAHRLLGGTRAKWEASRYRYVFPNGSILEFGHLDREEDVYRYWSAEYQDMCFDELTQFTERQYLLVLSRLRGKVELGIRPLVRAASNPGGMGHAWVKQRFIDPAPDGGAWRVELEDGVVWTRRFIPARLDDNPHIDKRYVLMLNQLPEAERRALRDGDWNVFSGQVFTEWSGMWHVVEDFEVPSSWQRFMSLDWGYAKPFCVLWGAVDHDGCIHVYREWYGCKGSDRLNEGLHMTAPDVARGILEREAGEDIAYRVADPACWASIGSSAPSIAEEFALSGVPLQRADNDRRQGLHQVHLRLQHGMLKVFRSCHYARMLIPAMVYDKRNPEDVDTEGPDHLYDALRYLCMTRPYSPRVEVPRKEEPWQLRSDEAERVGWIEW